MMNRLQDILPTTCPISEHLHPAFALGYLFYGQDKASRTDSGGWKN